MEALSFFHYLSREKLITFKEVELELVFVERELPKLNELKMNDHVERVDAEEENDKASVTEETTLTVTVPQAEYILGMADLTGELMRNAINSLGSGNMSVCFTLLDILQNMSDRFSMIPRDIGQKVYILKQICRKVENACYAISVRGSEIPKTHLADIFTQKREEGHSERGLEGDYFSD